MKIFIFDFFLEPLGDDSQKEEMLRRISLSKGIAHKFVELHGTRF